MAQSPDTLSHLRFFRSASIKLLDDYAQQSKFISIGNFENIYL